MTFNPNDNLNHGNKKTSTKVVEKNTSKNKPLCSKNDKTKQAPPIQAAPKPSEKHQIAACLLLVNPNNNQIIVTSRRNSTNLGLPGGKAEPGETPIDAAVRETKEETGICIDPKILQTLFIDIVHIDPTTGLQIEKSNKKNIKLFKTFCFFGFFDGDIPGGIEENIFAKWLTTDEFLQNSAFKIYDSNVVKTFKELPPV